ncbi:molybdopterin-dependent oxidoreductase [Fimbriiglobus ruber]|uniref:molybdopterin-dependent oxidoreductase n=1 Tax=Fimbriiglobus ruber TaxID=1908690 RepID=UPI00137AF4C8|nr:molybdopterin-dependent oxidoreductase [Fimbriiglobus ruber]
MTHQQAFLDEHRELTRRYFLRLGVVGAVAVGGRARAADGDKDKPKPRTKPANADVQPEPYFTLPEDFQDVSRGKPIPHRLTDAQKRDAGLTRETWKLEVISDPTHPAGLGKPLTKTGGTALDFESLLKLGEKHAVRFPKVMTCLNMGCPLGMGLWEGVPLREVVWLTQPRDNLRRVFYYGFHNDDPKQMFRSSLPVGRVLEDPFDLPPVILCYKLNGQWLNSERGGPVRVVVPEAYGFKSIKWLTHVVLTNLAHANDTYADDNNDVDSPLKTFAASLTVPQVAKAGEAIAVSGYAQVGISGLSKVQVSIEPKNTPRPADDPYFTKAPWVDAEVLSPPKRWGALADGKIPANTHGFDAAGKPKSWPMRLTNVHWAAVLPALLAGEYTFRSRTIDEKGHAQPMPRPFRKSGRAAIESVYVTVK